MSYTPDTQSIHLRNRGFALYANTTDSQLRQNLNRELKTRVTP
jgi:hypothetical protein